jgi:hypothetical protein
MEKSGLMTAADLICASRHPSKVLSRKINLQHSP